MTWVGFDAIGERTGASALYLAEKLEALWPVMAGRRFESVNSDRIRARGAVVSVSAGAWRFFFQQVHDGGAAGIRARRWRHLGAGVARVLLTNDALHALRAYCAPAEHEASASGA